MTKTFWIAGLLIAGPLVAGLLVAGPGPDALAQPEAPAANRIGLIVGLESPGVRVDEVALAAAVVRHVRESLASLADEGRLALVEPEALHEAQQRLGIRLDARSKPEQIATVARLLKLDRLVFLEVTIADGFRVAASATVFNARGQRLVSTAVQAAADEPGAAIERALGLLVRQLAPALL